MMYCTCRECCGDKDSMDPCTNAAMYAEFRYKRSIMDGSFWKVIAIASVVLFVISLLSTQ